MIRSHLFAALLAGLVAATGARAQLPVVAGEPAAGAKAEPAARLRLGREPEEAHVRLPNVAAAALEAVRAANLRAGRKPRPEAQARRVVIGVVREVAPATPVAQALVWQPVEGGFAARLAVTSPEAEAMRLALSLAGVPTAVEMVFFGSADPGRLEGPVRVGEVHDRTAAWWTPVTEGETQTVELFLPTGAGAHAPPVGLEGASHLVAAPSSRFTKRLQDIGRAGSCNVDVPCSRLAPDPAFQNAVASTAQMVFTDGSFMALCTGTLLNDADPSSQVPYFYSANHCFENGGAPYKTPSQMQSVANSLATLWFFEASACRSGTPRANWVQRSGGATFLYNHVQYDALLLRLNEAPPAGAFYSGWDANAMPSGTGGITIHHPQGDLKKVSEGSLRGFSAPGVGGGSLPFIEMVWASGTTEGGSSGSGVWTASGGQYVFRGGLWGGSASCENPSGSDYYSRFDLVYPSIAAWLGSSVAAVDYTDLWWNPSESGWGLNLIQHASKVIFGVWYTYGPDGKRTWFVIPEGTWTSARTYTGPVYATTGPHFTAAFDASKVSRAPVGSATLNFTDANNGTFSFSVNGVSGVKSITRQPF